jgi:hypothetical protein
MLPVDVVSHRNMLELFNVNFNADLILFLRLSNCASVGKKNFDNYQDARFVCEKNNCSSVCYVLFHVSVI